MVHIKFSTKITCLIVFQWKTWTILLSQMINMCGQTVHG